MRTCGERLGSVGVGVGECGWVCWSGGTAVLRACVVLCCATRCNPFSCPRMHSAVRCVTLSAVSQALCALYIMDKASGVTNQTITILVSYMFIHIAKTGGTSFDDMLGKGQLHPLVPCFMDGHSSMHTTICALTHCHVQMPVQKQACNTGSSEIATVNSLDIDPHVHLLTIIRDPIDHELSMFTHCQTPGATGQRLHGYPPISFADYLAFRMANPGNATFCGYSPFNMQVTRLGGGPDQLEAAIHVLKSAFWVGVTGSYDASLCLLRSKLKGQAACSCSALHTATHVTHGTRPGDVTLTGTMRRQIHFLAGLDTVLHAHALSRLQHELAAFNLSCLLHTTPPDSWGSLSDGTGSRRP